jgi:polysaccharide deacetylase family protein (PEP-CTERM system associated)
VDQRTANILTVDLEDWYHILDADGAPRREEWDGLESRVVANTERLLAAFEEFGARATFFTVGWIARRQPGLVRRIAEAGHEIASHSFWHEILQRHDRESLAADLGASRRLLEDLSGAPVRGFRAPGSSLTRESAWAFDVIVEQGFAYDASLCPGYSSHGGFASPFAHPHRVRCDAGELPEIPAATIGLLGRRFVYSGGGYLRLLPYAFVRAAIARENRAGWPSNVYLHPREIDPEQPRMRLPLVRRFKYYVGLAGSERKLRALLREHRFVGAWEWLEAHAARLEGRVLDVRAVAAARPPRPDAARVPPPPPSDPLVARG